MFRRPCLIELLLSVLFGLSIWHIVSFQAPAVPELPPGVIATHILVYSMDQVEKNNRAWVRARLVDGEVAEFDVPWDMAHTTTNENLREHSEKYHYRSDDETAMVFTISDKVINTARDFEIFKDSWIVSKVFRPIRRYFPAYLTFGLLIAFRCLRCQQVIAIGDFPRVLVNGLFYPFWLHKTVLPDGVKVSELVVASKIQPKEILPSDRFRKSLRNLEKAL